MKTLILILTLISSISYAKIGNHTDGGRFQLIQLSEFRRDQYMIDTETGKVWAISCEQVNEKEICEKTVLVQIERLDSNFAFSKNKPKL